MQKAIYKSDMYRVCKTLEIAGAHRLNLDYESKCKNLHGHNWIIKIYMQNESLDHNGMVMDFTEIKRKIHSVLDHQYINDVINMNPTAENIARWIADTLGEKCYKVSVQESEGNIAEYERDYD